MRRFSGYLAAITVSGFLAACGGGGGSSTPAVSAEGAWMGSTSTGYALNVLVLDNNEMWAIFGTNSNNYFTVYGFDRGVGSYSGNSFSGSGTEYFYTGLVTTGTFTATFTPGQSLNGTVNGAQRVTFSTTPMTSGYNYNTPASLTTVAGSWSGGLLNGAAASISVSSSGSVSGVSSGCVFNGTALPRASGKNVFNVSLTFGNSPCALPNQTVNGIALAYPTNTGRTQLMVAVTTASGSSGTMFFAQR